MVLPSKTKRSVLRAMPFLSQKAFQTLVKGVDLRTLKAVSSPFMFTLIVICSDSAIRARPRCLRHRLP